MGESCIRIAVIDDHPLMRDGIALALDNEDDIELVASGLSGDAFRIASELQPCVIIIGVNVAGGGLAVARRIASAYADIRLVFLTISERQEDTRAALEAGVRGYVLKGIRRQDLAQIIRAVAEGETYITPSLAVRLLGISVGAATGRWGAGIANRDLSAREQQILKGVALGMTNKEIASTMALSERTVKHHMTGVMRKLNVRNRVEAFLLLRGSGAEQPGCYPI